MFCCSSGVRISDKLAEAKQNIGQNLWVLAEDAYGLWDTIFHKPTRRIKFSMGFEGLWVIRGMGYQRYGLRGVCLYKEFRLCGNKGSEN